MKIYICKRVLLSLFLMWVVSSVTFFLVHTVPGDPVDSVLGEKADEGERGGLTTRLNLHKPLLQQYLDFNRNLLNLNVGVSFFTNKGVLVSIITYLPNTLSLAGASLVISFLISFPLGIAASFIPGRFFDSFITFAGSAGMAIPNIVLGPLLILFFSVRLDLLPVAGNCGFRCLILPALTLGLSMSAYLTRMIRFSLGAELQKTYILLARARGLNFFQIFFRHLAPNALMPIIATIGLQLGALMSGAIITETIFSRPGIGSLLIASVHRRDYPVIQGAVLFIAFCYLFIHLLADLAYFILEPRIRHEISTT